MGFEQQQSINFTCVRHPMPKNVYLVIITQVELQLTEKRADRKNFASWPIFFYQIFVRFGSLKLYVCSGLKILITGLLVN